VSPLAWALLAAGGAAAVGDWLAVARRAKALEYGCKPAAMALLVGVALALDPAVPSRRWWFVAAGVASLAGDVFLMLPADRFVAGLGSFLLAHLAYIVGFRIDGGSTPALAASAGGIALVAAVLARPILGGVRRSQPGLLVPVALYMTVISAMVAAALATGIALAAAGAALFLASDAMIAWERFVAPRRWHRLAIIVTYHLGQAGLVLSLTRGGNPPV
jgi:uncharacterized membrane protein YhhN